MQNFRETRETRLFCKGNFELIFWVALVELQVPQCTQVRRASKKHNQMSSANG